MSIVDDFLRGGPGGDDGDGGGDGGDGGGEGDGGGGLGLFEHVLDESQYKLAIHFSLSLLLQQGLPTTPHLPGKQLYLDEFIFRHPTH